LLERQELLLKYAKHPNLFWKEINNRKGNGIQMDIDLKLLREKYLDNFNSLSQTESSKALQCKMELIISQYISKIKNSNSDVKISNELIEGIIKGLKNKKKPGKNGVSNEMLKNSCSTQVPNILANLFESLINGFYCPKNINIGIIITIIKNSEGCNRSFDNSRPITISEPISMVLESVIINDFSRRGKLSKHQYGFKANSSCSHAVFALKEISNHARMNSRNVIALFLDFSKAFDKVNRTKLWFKLMQKLNPSIWLLLKNYYEQMQTFVIGTNGEILEPFASCVGVKQGGKFSPHAL
jgi:hypothetical protein